MTVELCFSHLSKKHIITIMPISKMLKHWWPLIWRWCFILKEVHFSNVRENINEIKPYYWSISLPKEAFFSQNVCCGCCCEFVGTVELYQLDNLWFGGVMRERVNKCFSHLLQTFGYLHVYVNRETCCQTVNNKRWQGAQVWKTIGKRAQVRGFCQRDVHS